MKRFKNALFLATIASSALVSSYAQAQTPVSNDGEAAVHGTGATSIQGVLVQELNCTGSYSDLGVIGTSTTAGTTSAVAEPTNLPLTTFNCSTTDLETGFKARYIASGSGTGRSSWIATGSLASTAPFVVGTANPNPFGTWSKVQFAFADSSITDGDLTSYNAVGGAASKGGAPIMFPKFVLPVAIAYSATYGHNSTTGTDYTFNISNPQPILANAAGGLRMSQTTYCGVFNGTIKNFKDAAFTTDNGGTSLMDPVDATENPLVVGGVPTNRWAVDGVPVRLVGRLDRSGTTDIFTRALAAQCGTVASGNHYAQNAETLPYKRSDPESVRPIFFAQRADTGLQTTSTQLEAGNGMANTMVGREYFDGSVIATPTANAGKTTSYPTGTNGSGLFLVADGSGKVAGAIKATGGVNDYASPAKAVVKLNGKIGYIGADFIDGSPSAPGGLKAMALEGKTKGVWPMPSAANATAAFGTIRPPQSSTVAGMAGVFDDVNPDTRKVRIPTYQGGTVGVLNNAERINPLAWYDVMYSDPASTLANPTAGYPITGTTQFVGYTCYTKTSTASNATAMTSFLKWNTDYIATNDSGGTARTGLFTRTAPGFTNAGLLARSNIGALPTSWMHAVRQTFLTNSTEASSLHTTLGGYNLWLDGADGTTSPTNNTCDSKSGV